MMFAFGTGQDADALWERNEQAESNKTQPGRVSLQRHYASAQIPVLDRCFSA